MRHSPSRRRSGFTFIELLVVFVVFSAVAAISVRSVGDTLRRDRVAKSAAVLGSDIEQAFGIAARQRKPVRMRVTQYNKKFYILDRNNTSRIYKTRSFASSGEYEVDSLGASTDFVDIMPNGLATDTMTLELIVKTTGGKLYSKKVRVSKGGLVRVDNR
jgi:prepilin-type N-terminal cleavage/methylation domain-containing protein